MKINKNTGVKMFLNTKEKVKIYNPITIEDKDMPFEECTARINFLTSMNDGYTYREYTRIVDETFNIITLTILKNYPNLVKTMEFKFEQFKKDEKISKAIRHFTLKWNKYLETGELRVWAGMDEEEDNGKDKDFTF